LTKRDQNAKAGSNIYGPNSDVDAAYIVSFLFTHHRVKEKYDGVLPAPPSILGKNPYFNLQVSRSSDFHSRTAKPDILHPQLFKTG
jgi:hypothetical protein